MAMKCANSENELCNQWFLLLSQASKNCLTSKAGIRRVYYKFADGREMLEDWKMLEGKARELVGRYWRKKSIVGDHFTWDVEIGDKDQVLTESHPQSQLEQTAAQNLVIRESNVNPVVISRSTAACYEWRVRNLPPPGDNYLVSIEPDSYNLVISTKNRKYYKKLTCHDLKRFQVNPVAQNLVSNFSSRALIIQYKKPLEIIEVEKKIWQEIISPLKAEECSKNSSGCSQT